MTFAEDFEIVQASILWVKARIAISKTKRERLELLARLRVSKRALERITS